MDLYIAVMRFQLLILPLLLCAVLHGASARDVAAVEVSSDVQKAGEASPDSASALAEAGDSVVVATRADSLAYAKVIARVGARLKLRVLGWRATVEVRGSDVGFEGVRYHEPAAFSGEHGEGATVLRWPEIHKVQVRGSAAKKGALTGAIVFGGLGLLVGLSVATPCSGNFDILCGASATDALGITLISTASGALVGGILGAPFRHWKTVYDSGVSLPLRISLADGKVMEAVSVEPRGLDMLRIVLLGGRTSYVAINQVHEIRDAGGTDWTADVLQRQRRLPK
jgi:hypothetical protein